MRLVVSSSNGFLRKSVTPSSWIRCANSPVEWPYPTSPRRSVGLPGFPSVRRMAEQEELRLPIGMRFGELLGYIAPGSLFFLCIYGFEGSASHLLDGPLKGLSLHLPLHTV